MVEYKVKDAVLIEDAELLFRNFAGRIGTYNSEGDRNFCIKLTPEKAEEMRAAGWSVKDLRPREAEEDPQAIIKVKVKYGDRPPKIVVITSKNREQWEEKDLALLDVADIKKADILFNPYNSEVNGVHRVTAYLKTAFITLDEDILELKYAIEDSIVVSEDSEEVANILNHEPKED